MTTNDSKDQGRDAFEADYANACTHELKADHEPFAALLSGEKTHEIRENDRDFKVGDTIFVRETRYSRREMFEDGRPLEYTGRTTSKVITHIQRGYGLPDGLVVLSLAAPPPAASRAQAIVLVEDDKDSITREQVLSWGKLAGFGSKLDNESIIGCLGDFAIFARRDALATSASALARDEASVAPAFWTEIDRIAGDYNPSTADEAELALGEMRDALHAALDQFAASSAATVSDDVSIATNEPRNVEGMTRAEFEQHLRVCLQHDNVRARERGHDAPLNGLASDQEREVAERVERSYPASAYDYAANVCPGCTAFDNGASEVEFVQGCEGCKARMQKIAGFGPLAASSATAVSDDASEARAQSTNGEQS